MLNKSEIMNLGIQLLERVRELHNLGFVHLDIKPSNIMADKRSEPGKTIILSFVIVRFMIKNN